MFNKGSKNSSDNDDLIFLEDIELDEKHSESDEGNFQDVIQKEKEDSVDELFPDVTLDFDGSNRIIIRDTEPRKKVRRRVKKGTKEKVLLERKKAIERKKREKHDETQDDNKLGLNHRVIREYSKQQNEEPEAETVVEPERKKIPKSYGTEEDYLSFRESSIDWQDEEYKAYKDAVGEVDEPRRLFGVSPISIVASLMGIIIFIVAIFSTVSYAKLKATENRVSAMEKLASFEESGAEKIAEQVESIEAPIVFEDPVEDEFRVLSLILSSVEKDLKVKLVDDEDTLVKGIRWSCFITNEGEDTTEEIDEDEDGIIHLTDVKAGEYSVEINPDSVPSEFEAPVGIQTVSVKAKIEYKVIKDIKEEIKTEKEVNAAVEDAQGNQAADVETGPVIVDTVEWCESSRTANGEAYVEATPDITKTVSNKSENRFLAVISDLSTSVRTGFKKGTFALRFITANPSKLMEVATENSERKDISAFDENPPANPDPVNEHQCSFTYKMVDDESHTTYCSDSCDKGYPKKESHSFDGSGKCTLCGYKKEDSVSKHTCTLSYSDPDASSHMVNCSDGCDQGYPKRENHSFDSDGKCTLCGYSKNSTDPAPTPSPSDHQHKFKYTTNNDGTHSVKCEADGCDGKYEQKEKCSYDKGKCTKCGYTQPQDDHKHAYRYTSNNNGTHDAICDCGVTIKKEKCDLSSGVCPSCGYVKQNSEYADDAQLYDAFKNALYVKEGDNYRLAKYLDYKSGSFSTYYRKAEAYLYTGWQTIDGKRYYYKSDNTFVTGDQIIGGVTYHFASDGVLAQNSGTLGIDVSKYQPNINWASVKASGINYVIIRCGYRGSSTGVLIEDPYFKSHIKGAKSVGLKVGVYFFTTAINEAEAVEEASMCAYLCSGYGIDYPVFMDCEPSGRPGYNGMSASQRTEIIKAFCNTIKSAGYTPGVYANKTWLSEKMNAGALSGYKIWLAQYNSSGPTYSGRYDLWQYTSKGSVNGIKGNVDMNQSYLGY